MCELECIQDSRSYHLSGNQMNHTVESIPEAVTAPCYTFYSPPGMFAMGKQHHRSVAYISVMISYLQFARACTKLHFWLPK